MANDNQTALQISIQRKKDRLKEIGEFYLSYEACTEKDILEREVEEDEKLLAVERDRTVEFTTEMLIRYGLVESRSAYKFEAFDLYHKKYGTDGK